MTLVYALSRATAYTKFQEIEETLLKVLELAEADAAKTRIALHEKTNVMVVRGSEAVHELVAALLSSLEQNTAENERSEVTKMQRRIGEVEDHYARKIEAAQREAEEARARRREAEQRMEEYRLQLEDLRAKLPAKN